MQRNQVEMFLTLDGLVPVQHPYRKFEALIDFTTLSLPLRALYSDKGRPELCQSALNMYPRSACKSGPPFA